MLIFEIAELKLVVRNFDRFTAYCTDDGNCQVGLEAVIETRTVAHCHPLGLQTTPHLR